MITEEACRCRRAYKDNIAEIYNGASLGRRRRRRRHRFRGETELDVTRGAERRRRRAYVWHARVLGLCRDETRRDETSGPRALPRGRIRNDAQNSRNWPTRGGQPIVQRRRTTPGVLSPSRRPDDAPLLPDRE